MQAKRKSKKSSRSSWLLALAFVTAVGFTVHAMKPSRPNEPAASAASTFAPTIPNTAAAPAKAPPGMVWIPGGEFSMGSPVESESLCSMPGMTKDASPIHRVYVDGFWMDATELTNEQFAKFV